MSNSQTCQAWYDNRQPAAGTSSLQLPLLPAAATHVTNNCEQMIASWAHGRPHACNATASCSQDLRSVGGHGTLRLDSAVGALQSSAAEAGFGRVVRDVSAAGIMAAWRAGFRTTGVLMIR